MILSQEAIEDVYWWLNESIYHPRPVLVQSVDKIIYTDASNLGWGATLDGTKCGGHWSYEETSYHINALELLAIKNGLLSLCKACSGMHVQIYTDNTTAVSYVNDMGGCRSSPCNEVSRRIWLWAESRKIWLSAVHIPGIYNDVADQESRVLNERTEWHLNEEVYSWACSRLQFTPSIDLFASRLNHQTETYVSWRPDPGAFITNAFHLSWTDFDCYLFPPFSIIARVLQKVSTDQARALMILPIWPTQPWFGLMLRLLVDYPLLLPNRRDLMKLPFDPEKLHPLYPKLRMLAVLLSGKPSEAVDFLNQHARLCCVHGAKEPYPNMGRILGNGLTLQIGKISIPFYR